MKALIFIDTNIFLDFYRVRGSKEELSILNHINKSHNQIITGEQIAMEYKKNRQRVILESLTLLKAPEWSSLSPPSFLSQSQPALKLQKSIKEILKQKEKLTKSIEKVLHSPAYNDPVYKVLQRLFKYKGQYNLTHDKKIRLNIRRLARERFIFGYPPKKRKDNSMGDALNWEWIIYCAKESRKDIVIVTRDSDFGSIYNNKTIINDWLRVEFKKRVGRRKLIITDKLSEGFKIASIAVTKKELKAENKLLKEITNTKATEKKRKESLLRSIEEFEDWDSTSAFITPPATEE